MAYISSTRLESDADQTQRGVSRRYRRDDGVMGRGGIQSIPKIRTRCEPLYIPSAPQVVRVMLAGESQISVTGGAAVVSANLGGADFVFIGGIVNVPGWPDVRLGSPFERSSRSSHEPVGVWSLLRGVHTPPQ